MEWKEPYILSEKATQRGALVRKSRMRQLMDLPQGEVEELDEEEEVDDNVIR